MSLTMGTLDGTSSKPIILDPEERINRFGVECVGPAGDGIVFKAGHWKPGGEYIQKLIVRNVSTTVKKLKYKLPSTRFFSMAYPEVIVLSPGMFKEIDVVFRPVEMNPYDDTIYIKLLEGEGSGGFHVPVLALISKLVVSAPFGVDLGYCATHQTTNLIFQISNVGEVDAPFYWKSPYPFVLEPSEGVIPVGESVDIRVSIFPEDATVYVAQAVCVVGEGVHAIIPEPTLVTRISAIGKYAYIVLSENLVDFGEVLVGTEPDSIPRDVLLRNNSVVPAEFRLVRHDNDRDEVFSVYPNSGVIPAQSSVTINIRYHSLAFGTFSLDRYSFQTPGNCTTTLTCTGFALAHNVLVRKEAPAVLGPNQDLTIGGANDGYFEGSPPNSLNFRDTEVGLKETRILFLKNLSTRPATFSIVTDPEGTFKIEPQQGTISGLLETYVKLTFSPTRPINYYKRIFVLINNALPQFLDVMGTGFIRARGEVKEQRPAPLRHAHIQAFRNRAVQGYSRHSPDELDYIVEHEGLSDIFARIGPSGTRAMSVTAIQNPLTRTGDTSRALIATAHEYFIEDTDSVAREIQLNRNHLDFGYTPHNGLSDAQVIKITNTTNGKVSVNWFVPAVSNLGGDKDSLALVTEPVAAFEVDPPVADINAGKSMSFRVYFRPKQSNRNFVSELEAFVFFKNQRTFRLVNDATMSPPWCLTMSCSGHTFSTGQLLAKGSLTSSGVRNGKLLFPCCYVHDAIYQTVMLKNTSNLPSTFKLHFNSDQENQENPVWSVKPVSGEVAAEDFVLICIRFNPNAIKKFNEVLQCVVNGSDSGKLLLEGHGAVPYLTCPDVVDDTVASNRIPEVTTMVTKGFLGSFFLKPTCVGLSFTRKFTIQNSSRLPLRYKIIVPTNAENIMTITPTRGVLRGKEQAELTIVFAPTKGIKYTFKLKILVYPVGGVAPRVIDARQPGTVEPPEILQQLSLNIIAPGEIGTMLFDPQRLTADVRLVGTYEMQDFFLQNVTDSDIAYDLFYKTEFVADTGLTTKETVISDVMPLLTTKEPGDIVNNLFCELPSGTLPARSRTRVAFTFHPSRAGLFEFLIFARVRAIDFKTGEPVMLSNEEVALLRVSQVERESMTVGQGRSGIEGHSLTAFVTGRASFPTMLFDDIRTEMDSLVSDVDQLWRQFSFASLNYYLSLPLTEEETVLNASSSPDLSVLRRYPFEFTPGVIGSPRQSIIMRIRNSGFLTTSFHVHFPNEKELDLEPWCDEDEPTEEGLMHIAIIEELKCFTVEPRHATLKPDESCVVTISYSHSHLKYNGLHKLPLLMKLDQGKMFWIDLIGRTIPGEPGGMPTAPLNTTLSGATINPEVETSHSRIRTQTGSNMLGSPPNSSVNSKESLSNILLFPCTGADNLYKLIPIPIGFTTLEAPKQKMEIVNVSSVDVAYEVDLSDVDRLISENHDLPIVRLSNPRGIIPARASLYLEWLFYPLEAVEYKFKINIKYTHANAPQPSSLAGLGTLSKGTGHTTGRSAGIPSRGAGLNASSSSIVVAPMAQAMGSNFTLSGANMNAVMQNLEVFVSGVGYDPREGKPEPEESVYIGGTAKNAQLLKPEKQFARLSFDKLDFGRVPQYATQSHLVLLYNESLVNSVDFAIDDSTSSLFHDGLLTVSSMYGRIEPNSHVVLNIKIHANTQPVLLRERIKICVRELVRGAQKKNNHKLLDKIRKKVSSDK